MRISVGNVNAGRCPASHLPGLICNRCGARAGGLVYFGTRTAHTSYPAGKRLF